MKPIFWLFDMDDTLVNIIDRKKDEETAYMTLNYQRNNPEMMSIFLGCKQINPLHVGIITGRHPNLKKEIQMKFELVNVWTRTKYLLEEEIMEACSTHERTEIFWEDSVNDKIDVMIELSEINF